MPRFLLIFSILVLYPIASTSDEIKFSSELFELLDIDQDGTLNMKEFTMPHPDTLRSESTETQQDTMERAGFAAFERSRNMERDFETTESGIMPVKLYKKGFSSFDRSRNKYRNYSRN